MTHLIDKDAIVAEINNWIKDAKRRYTLSKVQFSLSDRIESLENLLSFLNTLEVKEVEEPSKDLEEAAKFYAATHTEFFDSECKPHVAPAFIAGAKWQEAKIQAQSMAVAHGCPKVPARLEKAAKKVVFIKDK